MVFVEGQLSGLILIMRVPLIVIVAAHGRKSSALHVTHLIRIVSRQIET